MNTYQQISTVFGLSLFLPLAWQIWKGKTTQNLATFILWGSLDGIAAASIFFQGGNYQLPAAYTAGSILVILTILRSRVFKWTRFETLMSVLVFICIVGWSMSGPYLATILSTTGLVLASFPQIVDAWKEPKQFPTLLYCGYVTANFLGVLSGTEWSVEQRLYQVSAFAVCVVLVLASLRKYSRNAAFE